VIDYVEYVRLKRTVSEYGEVLLAGTEVRITGIYTHCYDDITYYEVMPMLWVGGTTSFFLREDCFVGVRE